MNLLISELKKRKNYLGNLLFTIEQKLEGALSGKLRISKNEGIPRYYHITQPRDTCGTYLSKEKQNLAEKLAEKDYLNKLKREAEAELHNIDHYIREHSESALEDKYENMNAYRKQLVDPLVIPDNLYVEQWENEPYAVNPYYQEHRIYPTKKGELVRSKSEVFLADMYYELGIPLNIREIREMIKELFWKKVLFADN